VADEQEGAARQPVKRHMGRRCFNWDCASRYIYMITITLADLSQPILGWLVGEEWRGNRVGFDCHEGGGEANSYRGRSKKDLFGAHVGHSGMRV